MYSEQEIVIGINNGDSKALKEFFTSFYPSLCVFTKKYVSELDVAQDIAQESFLLLWEQKKKFENIKALKGFLYSTARNKYLNHIKLKAIHDDFSRNELLREDLLYELVIEEETYRIIYQAIKKLPTQTSRIIELSMKGYKNQEISEELNVSINTVKTLKKNAYQCLRENLKEHVFVLFLLNQLLNM